MASRRSSFGRDEDEEVGKGATSADDVGTRKCRSSTLKEKKTRHARPNNFTCP